MDWQVIIIQALMSLPPTLVAAAAYRQAGKARAQSEETHKAVNGQMEAYKESMVALTDIKVSAATDAATLAEKSAEGVRKGAAPRP